MTKVEYYDIADNRISVGDTVAYAASWGRCPTLKYGLVVRLAERESKHWNKKGMEPTIRVVTVDRTTIMVAGVREETWVLQKDGKEVALAFLDRLLVVPHTHVPQKVKHIFADVIRKRGGL